MVKLELTLNQEDAKLLYDFIDCVECDLNRTTRAMVLPILVDIRASLDDQIEWKTLGGVS